jgi:hypothetical protein
VRIVQSQPSQEVLRHGQAGGPGSEVCGREVQVLLARHAIVHGPVWSNHRPLVAIWRKQIDKIGNARCQKWRENLSLYNFNVEWKEGMMHYVADSLSRAPYWDPPEIKTVFCFSINPTQGIHNILRKAAGKEDFKQILEAVTNPVSVKSIAYCHPAATLRSEWDYLSLINRLVAHKCKRIVIPSVILNYSNVLLLYIVIGRS